MLTCIEMTELITDYLEGRLSLMDRLRFRMHIGMCKDCRAFLRNRRIEIEALGALPPEPIPDDVRDELMEKFRHWKKEE